MARPPSFRVSSSRAGPAGAEGRTFGLEYGSRSSEADAPQLELLYSSTLVCISWWNECSVERVRTKQNSEALVIKLSGSELH